MAAGTARVRNKSVAHDLQRQLGLDQFGRLVREVSRRVGYPLDTVARGAGAPISDHDLGQSERRAVVIAADGEQGRAALAGGDHLVGDDLRQRPHNGVEDAVAHDTAGRTGGRQKRVEDGALGNDDGDRPHVALAVRDLLAADAADGAVGARFNHGDGAVDGRRNLRRSAGEIDDDLAALDAEGNYDLQRLGMLAEAVDVVSVAVFTVGNRLDLSQHHALGLVLKFFEVGMQECGAVLFYQPLEPLFADVAGGELGPEVAHHMDRIARIFFDYLEQRPNGLAALVELEERQPQPLLVDLGGVDGDATGSDAADVAVMGHGGGVALQRIAKENGLDDVDVGQVLAAGAVRIVGDEDVAGIGIVGVLGGDVAHDFGKGAELHRQGQALGDDLAVAVAQRRRIVHRVADHRRIGAAHDDQRHLVAE